jgi:hypothetical protein
MAAIGTKRTIRPHPRLSAIGVTADIARSAFKRDVDEKVWMAGASQMLPIETARITSEIDLFYFRTPKIGESRSSHPDEKSREPVIAVNPQD